MKVNFIGMIQNVLNGDLRTADRMFNLGFKDDFIIRNDATYAYSHIGGKQSQTTITNGKNTALLGTQVYGNKVKIDTHDLTIQSLQETSTYKSKQQNLIGQVTVGYGASVSASYNQSKVNSDYASVIEQSGIYAGDGGYLVNVQNHTEMTGGIMTSTEKAELENRNRIETGTLSARDVQNHSRFSSSGFGLSGGFSVSGGNAPKEIGGMKLKEIGTNHLDGSSKVEMSGIAGVTSQGNWGITKGLVSLLGQVSENGNEVGVTTSTINTHNILISDSNAQELTGKTSEEIVHQVQKINIHKEVNKVDIEKVRSDLNRDLNTVTTFVNNINNQGDEIYYRMEKNEDSIFKAQKKDKDCNHISCLAFDKKGKNTANNSLELKELIYGERILTEEEAHMMNHIATAGMLNLSDKEKVASAILYDKNLNSIDDTAIIANRGSAGIVNEFIFTVFERFRAWADKPAIFGASNATRDKAQIMHKINEYNKNALENRGKTVDVNAVAHSLGVSGDKNMLNWAEHLGQDYKHTKINFLHLGGSYPSEEIDQQAKSLFRNVNTEYIGVDGDWVYKGIFGSFIGNNPNATPANKLGFLKAHSDANQNINNLRFVEDDITKINDKSNVLKNIYQKTNGERIFNYIGYEKDIFTSSM